MNTHTFQSCVPAEERNLRLVRVVIIPVFTHEPLLVSMASPLVAEPVPLDTQSQITCVLLPSNFTTSDKVITAESDLILVHEPAILNQASLVLFVEVLSVHDVPLNTFLLFPHT